MRFWYVRETNHHMSKYAFQRVWKKTRVEVSWVLLIFWCGLNTGGGKDT